MAQRTATSGPNQLPRHTQLARGAAIIRSSATMDFGARLGSQLRLSKCSENPGRLERKCDSNNPRFSAETSQYLQNLKLSSMTLKINLGIVLESKPYDRPQGWFGRLRDHARRRLSSQSVLTVGPLAEFAEPYECIGVDSSSHLGPPPYSTTEPPLFTEDSFRSDAWYEACTSLEGGVIDMVEDNSPSKGDGHATLTTAGDDSRTGP